MGLTMVQHYCAACDHNGYDLIQLLRPI